MIKKGLGIALLTASALTLVACSSDDDADPAVTPEVTAGETPAETGGETPAETGGETPAETGGETPAETGGETPAETGGETPAETGGETPAETGGETPPTGGETGLTPGGYVPGTLTALVEANGGTSALAALKAEGLDLALNDPLNAWTVFLPTDAALAANTGPVNLQTHIYTTAAVDSTQATALTGNPIVMNDQSSLPIAGGGTEPLTLGGVEIVTVDLMVEGVPTIVHMINGVLTAP